MRESDLYVAILSISPKVSDKINQDHHITDDEVRDAVLCVEGLTYVWQNHPVSGVLRAIVQTEIRNREVLVVLYPAPDLGEDAYRLGSAYFTDPHG